MDMQMKKGTLIITITTTTTKTNTTTKNQIGPTVINRNFRKTQNTGNHKQGTGTKGRKTTITFSNLVGITNIYLMKWRTGIKERTKSFLRSTLWVSILNYLMTYLFPEQYSNWIRIPRHQPLINGLVKKLKSKAIEIQK